MMIIKIIKNLSLIFIIFSISACSIDSQNLNKDDNKNVEIKREKISTFLLNNVNQMILAMNENNINLINKRFIHPVFGYYDVYRLDNKNIFTHKNIIDNRLESKDEIAYMISNVKRVKDLSIKIEKVKFDCSPSDDEFYGWTKEGVFLIEETSNFISSIMKELNLIENDKYKFEDLKKAELIEKSSYKVIISSNLIFYVTKIDKQWYITLFDRISTNCSQ